MKKTFINRICVFMLALLMMVIVALPAYAADENEGVAGALAENDYGVRPETLDICPSWGVIVMEVPLSSYIGFSKTIVVETACMTDVPSTGGGVQLELYNQNGTKMYEYMWPVPVNQSTEKTFTLPKSGTYKLKVISVCDADIAINAYWK